jgi:hypothetical protein
MNWQDIKSSAIASIAFELDHGIYVLFNDGTEYLYKNAGYKLFKDWLKAKSKGRFFNLEVRGKFEGVEID